MNEIVRQDAAVRYSRFAIPSDAADAMVKMAGYVHDTMCDAFVRLVIGQDVGRPTWARVEATDGKSLCVFESGNTERPEQVREFFVPIFQLRGQPDCCGDLHLWEVIVDDDGTGWLVRAIEWNDDTRLTLTAQPAVLEQGHKWPDFDAVTPPSRIDGEPDVEETALAMHMRGQLLSRGLAYCQAVATHFRDGAVCLSWPDGRGVHEDEYTGAFCNTPLRIDAVCDSSQVRAFAVIMPMTGTAAPLTGRGAE